jgi:DNA primase
VPLIPPETIEQITASNDIVEVIRGYIPLKRAGVMWKALCPFHQERTPSFSVNPQRQIFKCFGCGAGGSVIRFVMTYESLDFISAAKKLAERAGIKLAEAEMSAEDTARYGMRQRLLALHAAAAEFFHYQLLKKPHAQPARDYLKRRGIAVEVAKSWKLGFAPDGWDALGEFARGEGYNREELIRSGLLKLRDEERPDSECYDRFRNRLMFPICNDTGEVIAFSGRVLVEDAKAAKYVNSPETMLFTKGAVLFGLHKSKRALIDKSSAVICEGQLDLITAFEAGIQNVVAPQGTAFTERQAHKLKQYVEEVVLCFDSDSAGQKAAERSLEHLLHENLLVRIVKMPPGEDPDSLIRNHGAAAFTERLAAAQDFFEFQLDRLAAEPDFATPRGRMRAARKMADFISLISDPLLRETLMNNVTRRLEISVQEFARMLKTPKTTQSSAAPEATPSIAMEPTIRLLAVVALHNAAARTWLLTQDWQRVLANSSDAGLLARILGAPLEVEDPASLTGFLAGLDVEEEACASTLLGEKAPENAMTIAQDCWRELERREIRRELTGAQARLRRPDLGDNEVTNLLKQVLDLQKRLSDIARPLSPPL